MQNRELSPSQEDRRSWVDLLERVRGGTESLADGLSAEDQMLQSMPEASPTKWHLAHTTWFYETFLLLPMQPGYQPFDPAFGYLFNSYYEAVGPRHPRPERGLLSRPGLSEVMAYRAAVTASVRHLIQQADADTWRKIESILELGLNHEEQHQELILMDIKHAFAKNALQPAYRPRPTLLGPRTPAPLNWVDFAGGLVEIGAETGFAFDNEGPRHRVWLDPYRVSSRLITAGEYLDFMADGGYRRPEFWLSDGWQAVNANGWRAPLYWQEDDNGWSIFTLAGRRPLDPAEPVVHVSYYEADAYARWAGHRLPREAEWEAAAATVPLSGNLLENGRLHPTSAAGQGLTQMIGDLWEWTESAYAAYPGFRAVAGAIGEYNGKFMSGQMVLRGGAAITPARHIRRSYRNFFPPAARWAFSGIRLAEDA
jgi:ergothioneine biosynthesis protein EgtB